jgi:leucyl aminopeptidase
MVRIRVENTNIDQKKTSLLVIGIFENERVFPQSNVLDPSISFTIKEIFDTKEFTGVLGSSVILRTMGKGLMKKIMLVGLGKREKFTNETARITAGKAALKAKEAVLTEFLSIWMTACLKLSVKAYAFHFILLRDIRQTTMKDNLRLMKSQF